MKLTAEQVAIGIKQREGVEEKITYSIIDPSAFQNAGGPSIAERMGNHKIHFSRADNKRVGANGAMGGWDQMRARLIGDGDGSPMIYCFSTCADSIRTIPALQHDPSKLEDVDTEAEDHAADEWRYGCMSRPWIRKSPDQQKPRHAFSISPDGAMRSNITFNELIAANTKARKRRERRAA